MAIARRLFVTCDFPPVVGGQANYFGNLWAPAGTPDDILIVPRQCRSHCEVSWRGRTLYMALPQGERWLPRIVRMLVVAWSVLRACLAYHPSQIHAGQVAVGGLSALAANALWRTPFILYVFGADLLEFSHRPWALSILSRILRHGTLTVTCSSYTADLTRETVPRGPPAVVVNPGVEERFFAPDPGACDGLRKRLGVECPDVLLTVGRLVDRKGHDVVLQALPAVVARVPNLRYVVAGDGPARGRLERLATDYGVASLVRFCGEVQDDDLPLFYGIATVFVMVPRVLHGRGDVEGYGIVYLEANAAGLPVVASSSGGVTDAVRDGDNGIVIGDPTDAHLVADAVVRLFNDDDYRRQLSANALRFAGESVWAKRRAQWAAAVG